MAVSSTIVTICDKISRRVTTKCTQKIFSFIGIGTSNPILMLYFLYIFVLDEIHYGKANN